MISAIKAKEKIKTKRFDLLKEVVDKFTIKLEDAYSESIDIWLPGIVLDDTQLTDVQTMFNKEGYLCSIKTDDVRVESCIKVTIPDLT